MAAKQTKRRGRPPVANPKDVQLNVRIDDALRDALEKYRVRHELDALSDATRHALKRLLRGDGLLPEK
jgi:hypothetical protein